jgi:hypothetical protein
MTPKPPKGGLKFELLNSLLFYPHSIFATLNLTNNSKSPLGDLGVKQRNNCKFLIFRNSKSPLGDLDVKKQRAAEKIIF